MACYLMAITHYLNQYWFIVHWIGANELTHWGWATHICVSKLTIIGSDNDLSPGRRQAIIWTNDGTLLIGPLGTNFSEILRKIHTFSFKKMHLKSLSSKWQSFCLGLNVLIPDQNEESTESHWQDWAAWINEEDWAAWINEKDWVAWINNEDWFAWINNEDWCAWINEEDWAAWINDEDWVAWINDEDWVAWINDAMTIRHRHTFHIYRPFVKGIHQALVDVVKLPMP